MRFPSKILWLALAVLPFGITGVVLAQPRQAPPRFVPPPGFMPPGGRPGMGRHGRFTTPPLVPAQVRTEIQGILATQPHEVFARLAGPPGRVLPAAERLDFARQAAARLATRIEVSNNCWNTLTETNAAAQYAESFDADLRADLASLVGLAERRTLADALFEMRHLADRPEWSETVKRGQEWRKRLRGLDRQEADRQSLQLRNEVLAALESVVRVGLERQALEVLKIGGVDKVAAEDLPPRLYDSVCGLRGLKTVYELARESRLDATEIARLKQNLDLFGKSLRKVPDADAALGAKILQDLAVRHFLQGHTFEYRALMPADGSPRHAARLLRDMKALALGKGEVVTEPAREILSSKDGEPPVGMRALAPEAARKNWRPPLRSAAKADPSPLDKAEEAGEILRGKIETDVRAERITWQERSKKALAGIEKMQRNLQRGDVADGKRYADVEAELRRPLEAIEKVRVRRLAVQKQTNRQIAAALKKQAAGQADAKNPRN